MALRWMTAQAVLLSLATLAAEAQAPEAHPHCVYTVCPDGRRIPCNQSCFSRSRAESRRTPSPDDSGRNKELEEKRTLDEQKKLEEQKRRQQEEFEREKQDALHQLKGVSSEEPGDLKGIASDNLDLKSLDTPDSFPLKGVGDGELKKAESPATENCKRRAEATGKYSELKQAVLTDEQVIHNFGFSQTAADIEAWGSLGEKARRSYETKAREVRVDVALDNIVSALKGGLSVTPVISQALSRRLIETFQAAGVPPGDDAYRIARNIGTRITPESARVLGDRIELARQKYDQLKDVRGALEADTALEFANSIVSVAGWFNPTFRLLAKDLDTLSLAVYTTDYTIAEQRISKLTTLAEGHLQELSNATKKLRTDNAELQKVRALLKSLPQCDTTTLVQR